MQNFCWSCYISHCRICQCCISHHFSREFMDHNHRERIEFDDRRFEIRVQFVLQFTLATAFLNILFSSISPPKQKSHLFAFPPKINSYFENFSLYYIYAYSFCFSTLELSIVTSSFPIRSKCYTCNLMVIIRYASTFKEYTIFEPVYFPCEYFYTSFVFNHL